MEKTPSQKTLKVISIIDIVAGGLCALLALLVIVGGLAGTGSPEIDTETGATLVAAGIVLLIAGILDLIVGILGLRAAKDNQKIMPVWVFAIISLIINVVSFIVSVVKGGAGQNTFSQICSIVIAALIFWVANNVKKEAGK